LLVCICSRRPALASTLAPALVPRQLLRAKDTDHVALSERLASLPLLGSLLPANDGTSLASFVDLLEQFSAEKEVRHTALLFH